MSRGDQLKHPLLAAFIVALMVACAQSDGSAPPVTPSPQVVSPPDALPRSDPFATPIPPRVTASALDNIRQTGIVRVGVLYNYPPFGYLADNGQVNGFEVELARLIAEHWGIEVQFVQVTRQTRLNMLYDGQIDMIAAALPHSRDLEEFVEFSDTTFLSGYVALVHSGQGIDELHDLSGQVVGTIGEGSRAALDEYAESAGISPVAQTYATLDDALASFEQAGGPSAIVGRREQMILATRSVQNTEVLDEFIRMEPYAFAVRNGDTPLRDLLNLTIQEIIQTGEYSTLFAASFYNTPSDTVRRYSGEASHTFADFPSAVSTDESVVARIRRGEAVRVAGFDLPAQPAPFDGQQVVDGYNRAVINEIARRWGISVIELPNSLGEAALPLLVGGQADIAVGQRPDLAQIGVLAYSQPYYQRGLRLIHLQGTALRGISDLEFKAVVPVEPLEVSQDLLQDNNGFAQIIPAASNEEAFQSLVSGAVYAVVGDEYSMMLMAGADTRIAAVGGLYRPESYAIALPTGDVELLALVNTTLQDMSRDGTLDALRAQYFGPYTPSDEPLSPFFMELWPPTVEYVGG